MRKLFALVASLAMVTTGLTALPSWANAPTNGSYNCNTGVIQNSPTSPNFTITNGVVSGGDTCVGDVVLPPGVTATAVWAFGSQFGGTTITSMSIPASLTLIGDLFLYGARAITTINVHQDNAEFASVDGVLFNKNLTKLLKYPPGKSGSSYTVPSSVTALGDWSFTDSMSLTSISVPNEVATLGMGSFARTGITSFDIPTSVTVIPDYAFESSSLSTITIPEGVTSINHRAFYAATSLASVSFTGPLAPSIGSAVFSNIPTPPAVTIPLTMTSVGSGDGWSGLSVTRPDGTVSCGGGGTFTVANNIVTGSTDTCSDAVAVPYGITSIGVNSFRQRAVTSVSIPRTVTSIGDSAFRQASLTSVTLPASLTALSNTAFRSNNNLADIEFLGTIPAGWSWAALTGARVSGKVNCGTEGYFVISQNTVVNRFNCRGSVEIPEGVTEVAGEAFDSSTEYGGGVGRENPYGSTVATQVDSLTIPNTVTSIGWFAFRSVQATSITIPDSVTSIGIFAFAGLPATSLTIGNGLTAIPDWAFAGYSSLTSLSIGTGVTSIGGEAFGGASALQTLTIPDGVASIGSNSFRDFPQLATVNYCGNASFGGTGLPLVASNASTCVPAPPMSLTATPGNGTASISFTPGVSGGSAITNYKYSLDGSTYTAFSPAVTSTPVTIPGLTNGSSYTLRLKAVSPRGDSGASQPVTFVAGASAYTNAAIGGVTAPIAGAIPVTSVTETSGYTGTVTWSGSPAIFSEETTYTATITLTAKPGHTFIGVTANFFTVSGATSVTNSADSRVVTAVFPATSGSDGTYSCSTGLPSIATPNFTLTSGVLTLGEACSGAVVIPVGVTAIGVGAFRGSNITSVSLPTTLTSIGENAFRESQLGSVVVPGSVAQMGECAFCVTQQLTSVVIQPGSLTNLGQYTFATTPLLNSVTLPNNILVIGDGVFRNAVDYSPYQSQLTSITLPSNLTTIGGSAFEGQNALTNLNIPDSVGVIGMQAFVGATSLTSIRIPASVTFIGDSAFDRTTSLLSINVDVSNSNYSSTGGVLFNKAGTILIKYPAAKTATSYTVSTAITEIAARAFSQSSALSGVIFEGNAPATVGFRAFFELADGAKALVDPAATGFADIGSTWNGLTVEGYVIAPPVSNAPSQQSPIRPLPKVVGVQLQPGSSARSAIVKLQLAGVEQGQSDQNIQIKIFDAKGSLFKVMTVPINGTAGSLEVAIPLAIGQFTVEANTIGAAGLATPFIKASSLIIQRAFYSSPASRRSPVLLGEAFARPVVFASFSSVLTASQRKALLLVAAELRKTRSSVAITGFSAKSGISRSFDKNLSNSRALAVARFLRAQGLSNILYVAGYGSISSQRSTDSSRKVELRIIK